MSENLYEVLGIKEDATPKQVKAAWRKLALKLHPDRNNGMDADFKRAERAFAILSDPRKRERYDQYGETDPKQSLERLGDFIGKICNPRHHDYLVQPLRELKHMKEEFAENVVALGRRRKIIKTDFDKLVASDRRDEVEVPITALGLLFNALAESIVRSVECKKKCVELIEQYEIAVEIVDRRERARPSDPSASLIIEALAAQGAGTVTGRATTSGSF